MSTCKASLLLMHRWILLQGSSFHFFLLLLLTVFTRIIGSFRITYAILAHASAKFSAREGKAPYGSHSARRATRLFLGLTSFTISLPESRQQTTACSLKSMHPIKEECPGLGNSLTQASSSVRVARFHG
uniref:Uncharacterized protein n=1 Tax=Ixodes ricinus TaxID=34613 RepID=A0A6B0UQI8_IXORI